MKTSKPKAPALAGVKRPVKRKADPQRPGSDPVADAQFLLRCRREQAALARRHAAVTKVIEAYERNG